MDGGSSIALLMRILGYFGLPLGLGGLLGWMSIGRRGARLSGAVAGGLAAFCLGVGAASIWAVPSLPAADAMLLPLLFGLGVLGAARPLRKADLAAAAVALVVTLLCAGLLEFIVVRWLPLPHYQPAPLEQLSFLAPHDSGSVSARRMVFAEASDEILPRLAAERVVLHVSDSMGLPPFPHALDEPRSFIDLLDRRDPEHFHLRAAVGGTGPDFYALLALNWSERYPLSGVVVHLSLPGDVADMGGTYRFCGPGPLLVDDPDSVRFRCPRGPLPVDPAERILFSPAPYPVRALALVSSTARHLAEQWRRTLRSGFRYEWSELRGEQAMWKVLAMLRRSLADRGIPLAVVLHPNRTLLGVQSPNLDRIRRWRAHLDGLGIRYLDATGMLQAAVAEYGEDEVYQNLIPKDSHYSDLGHRLMAEFLAAQLHL